MSNNDRKVTPPTGKGLDDERLLRHDNERSNIASTADREDRHLSDKERKDVGVMMSEDELAAMLRNEFIQEALPAVPKLAGYHYCWLSTTNSYDPIQKRMRIGYEPVKIGSVPGFTATDVREGEWAGFISCNELVLFRITEERYQAIMKLFHHQMPMDEEQAIADRLKAPDGADKQTEVDLEAGFEELVVKRRVQRYES